MSQDRISQYYLLNSNIGHAKIIEFDTLDGIIYIWGIGKKYSYCKTCSNSKDFFKCSKKDNCPLLESHKDEIQDPEYFLTGDFEKTWGYFSTVSEFLDTHIRKTYPQSKTVPLGVFNSIYECRKFLEQIKATLSGIAI